MRQFDNEIILSAKIDDLDKLQDWMGVFLDGIKCPAKICSQIAVVTEEVFVNICSYAYPDKEGYVLARVKLSGPRLILQFEDSGKAFNPLEHEIPDVSAPLAGRDIGGLGIFLTRKWMDAITYDRINGKNQLTLHKSMKKIALIHGGTSTEQAVSTINAGHIEAALARQGYKTFMVTYNRDMVENLRSLAPDLAWVCVQGKGHGDGTVQSILDFMGIPYTGSRALGAQIINDKILCKELFKLAGIRTPDWRVISLGDYRSGKIDFSAFGYPFVAKAPTQGYSFGIELIESPGDLSKIDAVFAFDDPIYIEKFIPGHNAMAGLLEQKGKAGYAAPPLAFPPVGHTIDGDKENYTLVKAGAATPVVLRNYSETLTAEIKAAASKVFSLTRAGIYARVDFRISSEDGLPYALEINAVPGLRPAGYYARGAELSGIDYDAMIDTIIHNSIHSGKKHV